MQIQYLTLDMKDKNLIFAAITYSTSGVFSSIRNQYCKTVPYEFYINFSF